MNDLGPNPVLVDDRTGSGDLLPVLKAKSVPCALARLEYGDISFFGRGPDGCPVPIGAEIKQLSDVLKCITDGRFAGHQLPGLIQTYTYTWLIVEGIWRGSPTDGVLQHFTHGAWKAAQIGQRRFMLRELDHWLLTMSIKGGIRIEHASSRTDTARIVTSLYRWWTDKSFDEHRSHLAADQSHCPDAALLVRPSLVRMVAKELPGIGWEKAGEVAKKFPTVVDLAVAEEEDWTDIPGIGPTTAKKAVSALRGGKTRGK